MYKVMEGVCVLRELKKVRSVVVGEIEMLLPVCCYKLKCPDLLSPTNDSCPPASPSLCGAQSFWPLPLQQNVRSRSASSTAFASRCFCEMTFP